MTPGIGERVAIDLPGARHKLGTVTEGPVMRYGKPVYKVTFMDASGEEASIWLWQKHMKPLRQSNE